MWLEEQNKEEREKKEKVEASNFGDGDVATYHYDCI